MRLLVVGLFLVVAHVEAACSVSDWSTAFNTANTVNCPAEHFMDGVLALGSGNELADIDSATCCTMVSADSGLGFDDVVPNWVTTFDSAGWSLCQTGFFMVGLIRSGPTALTDVGVNSCTSSAPCALCHSDCDFDADCVGNLKCWQRNGLVTPVPGNQCALTGMVQDWDYCYDSGVGAIVDVGVDSCTDSVPCGLCGGDCDRDSQCAGHLRCYQRESGDPIPPGCAGTMSEPWDYCYDPTRGQGISMLENAVCRKPRNLGSEYDGACTDVTFAAGCPAGMFMVGLSRGASEALSSITMMRCCKPLDVNCGTPANGVVVKTQSCTIQGCVSTQRCMTGFEPVGQATSSRTCNVNGEWVGPEITCVNKDECASGAAKCGPNMRCVDTEGKWYCTCESGFKVPVARTNVNVGVDSCTSTNPCAICEGDCDRDTDCAANLLCWHRDSAGPFGRGTHAPGCPLGGMNNAWDYCYDPAEGCVDIDECAESLHNCHPKATCVNTVSSFECHCNAGNVNDVAVPKAISPGTLYCTPAAPCGRCQGDCDSDNDCMGTLKCHQRDAVGLMPGCPVAGLVVQYDYCVENLGPVALTSFGFEGCTPTSPCEKCQGDCDTDADCAGTLKCFHRSGEELPDTAIPGCPATTAVTDMDYCYQPEDCTVKSDMSVVQGTPPPLSMTSVDSATDCQLECAGLPGCTAWHHDTLGSTCFLNTHTSPAFQTSSGFTAGNRCGPDINGRFCVPENECADPQGLANCGLQSECEDLVSGFRCLCLSGYEPARPSSTQWRIEPTVSSTWDLEGVDFFTDSDCLAPVVPATSQATGSVSDYTFGSSVSINCIIVTHSSEQGTPYKLQLKYYDGTVLQPAWQTRSLSYPTTTTINNECTDIDECQDPSLNDCSADANCLNLEGGARGFACECKPGFQDDNPGALTSGTVCSDINECSQPSICPELAVCHNEHGTYQCSPYIIAGSALPSGARPPTTGGANFTVQIQHGTSSAFTFQELTFGTSAFPNDFICTASKLVTPGANFNVHDCTLGPGAGSNIHFAVTYQYTSPAVGGTSHVRVARSETPDFDFEPAALIMGTLRPYKGTDPFGGVRGSQPSTFESTSTTGDVVEMEGAGMSLLAGQMRVEVGRSDINGTVSWPCHIDSGATTQTLIVCLTDTSTRGPGNHFTLFVGRPGSEQQATGADTYSLPETAKVTSVSGCSPTISAGGIPMTKDCPTRGDVPLTIRGEGFSSPLVLVDSAVCKVNETALTDWVIECRLPPGVGLERPIIIQTTSLKLLASIVKLVSYARPTITSISVSNGCVSDGPLKLVECLRSAPSGTAKPVLLISGENFGASKAQVFIGASQCNNTEHIIPPGSNPVGALHRFLRCDLPEGNGQDRPIFVRQYGGEISITFASLSHAQCLPGTYLQDVDCVACPEGHISTTEGASSCLACPRGTVQPIAGKAVCRDCLAGSYQDQQGQQECKLCTPGDYLESTGQISCLSCPRGRFSQVNGSTVCVPCAIGTFQDERQRTSCKPCPFGTFTDSIGQAECKLCGVGRFTAQAASTSCGPCAPGTVQSLTGGQNCTLCAPGSIAPLPGMVECVACARGTYLTASKGTKCVPCPAGTFEPEEGQAVGCQNCSAGFVSSRGAERCEACAAGKATMFDTQNAECTDCPIGRHQPAVNGSVCIPCPPGYVGTATGQVSCTPCSRGTAKNTSGAGICQRCPPGRFGIGDGNTECLECEQGFSNPAEGQSLCISCQPGRIMTDTGASECSACLAGSFQSQDGQTKCEPCEIGRFSNEASKVCTQCGPTSFAPTRGNEACEECPRSSRPDEGRTACLCNIGFYLNAEASECILCDPGARCEVEGIQVKAMETRPGFWRQTGKNENSSVSLEFYRCLVPRQCLGGVTSKCALHREGPMCAVCSEGYKALRSTSSCDKCLSKQQSVVISVVIMAVVVIVFGLMFAVVIRAGSAQAKLLMAKHAKGDVLGMAAASGSQLTPSSSTKSIRDLSSADDLHHLGRVNKLIVGEMGISRRAPNILYKMKILVSFFQIAYVIAFQGQIPWPATFQSFLAVFSFLNLDFIPWQSLGCAVSFTFYTRALIVALLPFAVLAALALFVALPMFIVDRRDQSDHNKYRQKRLQSRIHVTKLVFFVTFLLYPHVSGTVLSVYNCINIGGTQLLMADLNIVCYTPDWISFAGPFGVFILVYPIGIPVIYFLLLRRNCTQLEEPLTLLQLGFLYDAYGNKLWFWEIVDMLHKLSITSLIVFLPNNMEMAFDMAAVTSYLIVILIASPYIRKGDDRLSLLAQAELMCLSLMGWTLASLVEPLNKTLDLVISALLIGLVLFFIIACLVISLRNGRKILRSVVRTRKLKQMEKMNSLGDSGSISGNLGVIQSPGGTVE